MSLSPIVSFEHVRRTIDGSGHEGRNKGMVSIKRTYFGRGAGAQLPVTLHRMSIKMNQA